MIMSRKEPILFQEDEMDRMINEDVNNSPIVQLVNNMLEQAVRQRASDIHIEALEKKVRDSLPN